MKRKKIPPPPKPTGLPGDTLYFVRYFRHYRTGKLMDAWDYGYKGWPIRCKAK